MEKLRVFETFAGIGAQHKALEILKNNLENFDYEIVATSEWDIWANISYNAIHHDNKIIESVTEDEMISYLEKFSHSYDSKKPVAIDYLKKRMSSYELKLLYSSYINANNLGSITEITGDKILSSINTDMVDLITYSFPCQDLSVAGSFHGFNQGMKKGMGTRSGLLWEIERILNELSEKKKLPKFLLLENVKNMLSEKHKEDYIEWLKFLNKLGYKTKTFILDAENFGIPQHRERVYALSILEADEKFTDTLFESKHMKVVETVSIPVDVSAEHNIKKNMWDILKINYKNKKNLDEAITALAKRTPSRKRMYNENFLLHSINENEIKNHFKTKKDLIGFEKIKNGFFFRRTRTLTTKQDRNPNAGVVSIRDTILDENKFRKENNYARYRFITNREAYRFMGFDDDDVDKIYLSIFGKKEIKYRQAGNSIVVNVLVAIFSYVINNCWINS